MFWSLYNYNTVVVLLLAACVHASNTTEESFTTIVPTTEDISTTSLPAAEETTTTSLPAAEETTTTALAGTTAEVATTILPAEESWCNWNEGRLLFTGDAAIGPFETLYYNGTDNENRALFVSKGEAENYRSVNYNPESLEYLREDFNDKLQAGCCSTCGLVENCKHSVLNTKTQTCGLMDVESVQINPAVSSTGYEFFAEGCQTDWFMSDSEEYCSQICQFNSGIFTGETKVDEHFKFWRFATESKKEQPVACKCSLCTVCPEEYVFLAEPGLATTVMLAVGCGLFIFVFWCPILAELLRFLTWRRSELWAQIYSEDAYLSTSTNRYKLYGLIPMEFEMFASIAGAFGIVRNTLLMSVDIFQEHILTRNPFVAAPFIIHVIAIVETVQCLYVVLFLYTIFPIWVEMLVQEIKEYVEGDGDEPDSEEKQAFLKQEREEQDEKRDPANFSPKPETVEAVELQVSEPPAEQEQQPELVDHGGAGQNDEEKPSNFTLEVSPLTHMVLLISIIMDMVTAIRLSAIFGFEFSLAMSFLIAVAKAYRVVYNPEESDVKMILPFDKLNVDVTEQTLKEKLKEQLHYQLPENVTEETLKEKLDLVLKKEFKMNYTPDVTSCRIVDLEALSKEKRMAELKRISQRPLAKEHNENRCPECFKKAFMESRFEIEHESDITGVAGYVEFTIRDHHASYVVFSKPFFKAFEEKLTETMKTQQQTCLVKTKQQILWERADRVMIQPSFVRSRSCRGIFGILDTIMFLLVLPFLVLFMRKAPYLRTAQRPMVVFNGCLFLYSCIFFVYFAIAHSSHSEGMDSWTNTLIAIVFGFFMMAVPWACFTKVCGWPLNHIKQTHKFNFYKKPEQPNTDNPKENDFGNYVNKCGGKDPGEDPRKLSWFMFLWTLAIVTIMLNVYHYDPQAKHVQITHNAFVAFMVITVSFGFVTVINWSQESIFFFIFLRIIQPCLMGAILQNSTLYHTPKLQWWTSFGYFCVVSLCLTILANNGVYFQNCWIFYSLRLGTMGLIFSASGLLIAYTVVVNVEKIYHRVKQYCCKQENQLGNGSSIFHLFDDKPRCGTLSTNDLYLVVVSVFLFFGSLFFTLWIDIAENENFQRSMCLESYTSLIQMFTLLQSGAGIAVVGFQAFRNKISISPGNYKCVSKEPVEVQIYRGRNSAPKEKTIEGELVNITIEPDEVVKIENVYVPPSGDGYIRGELAGTGGWVDISHISDGDVWFAKDFGVWHENGERGFAPGKYKAVRSCWSRKDSNMDSEPLRSFQQDQIVNIVEIYKDGNRIRGKLETKSDLLEDTVEWVTLHNFNTKEAFFQLMSSTELSNNVEYEHGFAPGKYKALRRCWSRKTINMDSSPDREFHQDQIVNIVKIYKDGIRIHGKLDTDAWVTLHNFNHDFNTKHAFFQLMSSTELSSFDEFHYDQKMHETIMHENHGQEIELVTTPTFARFGGSLM